MVELNAKKISAKLDSVSFLLDDLSKLCDDDALCINDSYRLFVCQSELLLVSLNRLSKHIDIFRSKIVAPRLL